MEQLSPHAATREAQALQEDQCNQKKKKNQNCRKLQTQPRATAAVAESDNWLEWVFNSSVSIQRLSMWKISESFSVPGKAMA